MVPRHQVHQVSIDLKRKNGKLWSLHEDIVTGSTYQNFDSSLLSIGSILYVLCCASGCTYTISCILRRGTVGSITFLQVNNALNKCNSHLDTLLTTNE
jgi:hypothetical protein